MSAEHTINGRGFSARLIRSARRKTLGIVVRRGSVQVRAPQHLALKDIMAFVEHKTPWVQGVIERHRQLPVPRERTFNDGEPLAYLGRPLTLQLLTGSSNQIRVVDAHLHMARRTPGTSATRRKQLADWYRQEAEVYFTERCAYFSERLGLAPSAVKVRLYKSRWGSCTTRGAVHFNWLLMMAPPEVLDYVVVHELCHLRHFDHSPAFWALVASVLPDYQTHNLWLKRQTSLYW